MAKRKGVSKKLRFEVFKRDGFTCQYCGRMAPDVVLEVDHINPVSNGGDNDIMNLITSCIECNRGKGKNLLSQNDEIKKQQEQLILLNQKREQMELLLQWKKELLELEDKKKLAIEQLFKDFTGHTFNESGKSKIAKLLFKFDFEEVYTATEISLQTYYNGTEETVQTAFNYISRICYNRRTQQQFPLIKDINILVKMAKNKFVFLNFSWLKSFLVSYLTQETIEVVRNFINLSKSAKELKSCLLNFYNVERF